jgi:hypothetical protein
MGLHNLDIFIVSIQQHWITPKTVVFFFCSVVIFKCRNWDTLKKYKKLKALETKKNKLQLVKSKAKEEIDKNATTSKN